MAAPVGGEQPVSGMRPTPSELRYGPDGPSSATSPVKGEVVPTEVFELTEAENDIRERGRVLILKD